MPEAEQQQVEQIVRVWMHQNYVNEAELYEMSRVDSTSVWYYDKVPNSN